MSRTRRIILAASIAVAAVTWLRACQVWQIDAAALRESCAIPCPVACAPAHACSVLREDATMVACEGPCLLGVEEAW